MLSRFFILTFLMIFTSCALFKKAPSLSEKDLESLFSSIQLEGEGRGRLSIDQHQYLFSFESALQENNDWILAASIPLHGEEAMVLTDLSKLKATNNAPDAFEVRIKQEMLNYLKGKPKLPQGLASKFIPELRRLIRFVYAPKLKLNRTCQLEASVWQCDLDGEKYQVVVDNKQIKIKKVIAESYFLELSGENLTGPIFSKTNVNLHSQNDGSKSSSILFLELFWK